MRARRAARWLFAIALVLYFVHASYGIAGPAHWGHYGFQLAEYLGRARATLRYGELAPVMWWQQRPPPPNLYYLHHPAGFHYLLVPFVALFGERTVIGHATGVVAGIASIFAIKRAATHHFSALAGSVAALLFVTTPLVAAYAILPDPMFLEIACCVVAVDEYLRGRELRAALALAIGTQVMWEALFVGGILAAHAVTERKFRRAARMVAGPALVASLHLLLVLRLGLLNDMRESYAVRHGLPLLDSVPFVTHWIKLMFAPALLFLGVVHLLSLARRPIDRRDLLVAMPLIVFAIYYALFRQTVVVHAFRTSFLTAFFALAAASLIHRHRGAGVAVALVVIVCTLPFSFRVWRESRRVFGSVGQPYPGTDAERLAAAQEISGRTNVDDLVLVHSPGGLRPEVQLHLQRDLVEVPSLASALAHARDRSRVVLFVDRRELLRHEQPQLDMLMRRQRTVRFDDFAMMDLSNGPGLEEFRLEPAPSSAAARWFVHAGGPPLRARRIVTPSAQCQRADGLLPLDPGEPVAPDPTKESELICHHNYRVALGDRDGAVAARKLLPSNTTARLDELTALMTRATGTNGSELVAVVERAEATVHHRLRDGEGMLVEEISFPLPPRAGHIVVHTVAWQSAAGEYRWSIASKEREVALANVRIGAP